MEKPLIDKREFVYKNKLLFLIISCVKWYPNPAKSSVKKYIKLIAINARKDLGYAETTTDVDIVWHLQKIFKSIKL